jgi:hypothetical protein
MMRAGSTLQYNIVRRLLEKMQLGVGEGFFEKSKFRNFEAQFDQWARSKSCHVIKTHEIYPKSVEMVASGEMKICYIYRDIRDVAMSTKRKFGCEGSHLFAALDHAIFTYYQMKTTPGVLWQKYENVIKDLPGAVRTIASYLDLKASEDIVFMVVRSCSLDRAIKTIENISWNVRFINFTYKHFLPIINSLAKRLPKNLKTILRNTPFSVLQQKIQSPKYRSDECTLFHPDHISKDRGAVGVWQKGLCKEEIEVITKRYRLWYLDAGYIQ